MTLAKAEGARSEPATTMFFDGVEALVCAARDDQSNFLIRELQRLRLSVRHVWPMPELLPCEADVMFCEYGRHLSRQLPWVPGDPKSALVVVLPLTEPVDPETIVHLAPHGLLARPFTANAVLACLVHARSQFRYENRLRGKAEKLDENLRAMRTVERAKGILMETRHIGDDEAYNFIRRQAMDRRVSVAQVATAIVASHDIMSPRGM